MKRKYIEPAIRQLFLQTDLVFCDGSKTGWNTSGGVGEGGGNGDEGGMHSRNAYWDDLEEDE